MVFTKTNHYEISRMILSECHDEGAVAIKDSFPLGANGGAKGGADGAVGRWVLLRGPSRRLAEPPGERCFSTYAANFTNNRRTG